MKNIITTLLFIFVCVGNIFAQQQIVQGHRLPRLTTDQRNQIPVDSIFARGLVIFNTDVNCQQFWNGGEWISLCGVVDPEMDVPADACHRIRVHGRYFKDAPLDNSHFITMPILVTEPGTYTLTVRSNNGYFFHTSGVFTEPGTYDLTLLGMGLPTATQIDQLTFFVNGAEIATSCNITVEVQELTMGYRIDCFDIRVVGEYIVNRIFLDEENHVVIPVEVLGLGTTTIRTDQQNGIRFSGSREFTELGRDSIVLFVDGVARQEGDFRFYFTTDGDVRTSCSFTVSFISTIGTYENPACNCLQIAQERPFAPNGEFWVRDCMFMDPNDSDDEDLPDNTPRFRVFCDISGGGWMLVWSYSENTARNLYGTPNTMVINGNLFRPNLNVPRNVIGLHDTLPEGVYDGPTNLRINYTDFRLPVSMWRIGDWDGMRQEQIRIRITTNPTDMRDAWAANNFVIMSPRHSSENPIRMTWANTAAASRTSRPPSVGRVFGARFEVRLTPTGGGTGGGWSEHGGGRRIRVWNVTGAGANAGFSYNFNASGSTAAFQVRPDLNGGGAANTISMANMHNMFGNPSTTMPNHHFGRCPAGDDYSFTIRTCAAATMIPHSFNNGEGRFMQWWVR
ncbi:MAG: hypothetical protein FWC94_00025 [Bacteroidales bacterium]|nr:hypothetical protein [Bacteroidales bacterium]